MELRGIDLAAWVRRSRLGTTRTVVSYAAARSSLAQEDGIVRLWRTVWGDGCSFTATKTPTNNDMDTERRIRRLQVDAALASPGHVGRYPT